MKEAERYLNQIPMWAVKKNSLPDIRDFLEEADCQEESMKIIHVAGTNGKGSVCAYMTSILTAAGYQVGTFISPHLITVRERFLFNGRLAEEGLFVRAFESVKRLSERMGERGYQPPTYFEFLFYMFMMMCKWEKPDYVILETGLGGLLDTTNVIRHPILTVITSISMDHMRYLGNSVREIAAQKAGIIKPGIPVVYDDSSPESSQVILERAEELHCPVCGVSGEDYHLMKRDEKGANLLIKTEAVTETGSGGLRICISSKADYQMANGTLAVRAIDLLAKRKEVCILADAVRRGIEESRWPGRMEEVLPEVYLDGAHNIGGMEALAGTICRMQKETDRPVSLMFGVVSDKEYHQMIKKLCQNVKISHVTIARMDTERSVPADELAEDFRKHLGCPVESFDTVSEAWNHFLQVKGNNLAFCAGSLYLAGEVKALCAKEEKND